MDRDSTAGTVVLLLSLLAILALVVETVTGRPPLGIPSDVPFAALMFATALAFYGEYGLERRTMTAAIGLLALGAAVTLARPLVGWTPLGVGGELLVVAGIGLYLLDRLRS